jgi:peptide/nickel transport system permease protein
VAAYLARRIGILFVILFGSSFILYNLAAISGDPLEALRLSTDPAKEARIAELIRSLQLDTPPPLRYFGWLKGVLSLDFGLTREQQEVTAALAQAVPTSIRLVFVATIVAIILGLAIGIITALRQYSGFDYSMTFVSFLLFSLPIFWVAVLLKEYLAIQFNDFLFEPVIGRRWIAVLSVIASIIWMSILGGDRKKKLITFGASFVIHAGLLYFISSSLWLSDPFLGPVVILVLGIGIAFGMTQLSIGIGHRPTLYASLTMAVVGFLMYWPAQTMFEWENRRFVWPALLLATILVGFINGTLWSKIDRAPVIRASILTAVLMDFLLVLDKTMRTFKPYMETDAVYFRPVPTIGQVNPLLEKGDFWITFLDIAIHLVLPTFALLLISFAGYVRYARGTLLEVLNQDYIRTARAKGLPERTVIMRHAFRNTLIPLTTIMVVDFAGIIGGAIITERVFGWTGMGTLFNQAITTFDLNLLMGVFFITATMAVTANLIADLLYSALDPRIRVAGGE